MANLKEVRTRIESVKSTRQITSAMKLVAASKLRKAQNAVLAIRPYANKLKEIMSDLSSSIGEENAFVRKSEDKKILIVVFTSNKGLCGPFNTHVIKKSVKLIEEKYGAQHAKGNVHIISFGKKSSDYFEKNKYPFDGRKDKVFDNITFQEVSSVAEDIMKSFVEGTYDRVEIVYNKFVNAASQIVVVENYLPLESAESTSSIQADYIFEPSKKEIVTELIPKTLKVQLYKSILDSNAAENGARMTAMHMATDNATQMIKDLQLSYNKARQEAITNEILEVVSGAEALNG
ncbi:MAG: ATP synthase F1 subunit gamma [Bacteroidota bacterium]|nr:ATP synthase F1 subunit gamma [Bacteroidota bacterium]